MKKISLMFICVMLVGCGTKQSSFINNLPKGHVIDTDNNGIIDDKDVMYCIDTANSYLTTNVQPFLIKASIDSIEKLNTTKGRDRIDEILTVKEKKTFMQNEKEYKKLQSNINATAKASADRIINSKKLVKKSGKVCACQGSIVGLQDGITIKYAGIKMPTSITGRYSTMVSIMSLKLTSPNLISYELTGSYAPGNIPEAYVYCNDLCINEELVKRGYAIAIRDGTDKSITLIKLEEEAKQNKRGLWAFIADNPFAEPLY